MNRRQLFGAALLPLAPLAADAAAPGPESPWHAHARVMDGLPDHLRPSEELGYCSARKEALCGPECLPPLRPACIACPDVQQYPGAEQWFREELGTWNFLRRFEELLGEYQVQLRSCDLASLMVLEGLATAALCSPRGNVGHPYLEVRIRATDPLDCFHLDLQDHHYPGTQSATFLHVRYTWKGGKFHRTHLESLGSAEYTSVLRATEDGDGNPLYLNDQGEFLS